jgi:hypothetical protein
MQIALSEMLGKLTAKLLSHIRFTFLKHSLVKSECLTSMTFLYSTIWRNVRVELCKIGDSNRMQIRVCSLRLDCSVSMNQVDQYDITLNKT